MKILLDSLEQVSPKEANTCSPPEPEVSTLKSPFPPFLELRGLGQAMHL